MVGGIRLTSAASHRTRTAAPTTAGSLPPVDEPMSAVRVLSSVGLKA